jgi:hypothetical protein
MQSYLISKHNRVLSYPHVFLIVTIGGKFF